MHLTRYRNRPYVVINGKDYAVIRWFDAGRPGPLLIQVAGRTPLHREDLPTDDWVVVQSGSGQARISTAWRKQWFDYRPDATRKLAFLGASTDGSYFLLLRYIARRFGIGTDDAALAVRASAASNSSRHPPFIELVPDIGLTDTQLLILDSPASLDSSSAASLVSDDID